MGFNRVITTILATALLLIGPAANSAVQPTDNISLKISPPRSLDDARVDVIDTNHNSVVLTDCPTPACSGDPLSASIADNLKPNVSVLHVGDHVMVSLQIGPTRVLQSISLRSQFLPASWRILAMSAGYAATLLLATFLTAGHPIRLIVGEDNRYSNSKFQMALWFSIMLSTYITMVACRVIGFGCDFWGGVNIPTNLLALSGASALTFGAAKGITTAKVQTALAAGTQNPKSAAGSPHFMVDLVCNDIGAYDLGDFQMLVFTLLAVAMYLVWFFHWFGDIQSAKSVTLPDVDTTILAAFGLGQGAYLTKKAAGNVGTS